MSEQQKAVRCIYATATSLQIKWDNHELTFPVKNFEGYEIKGKRFSEDGFETFGKTRETEFTLKNLKSDSSYEIKIYYIIDGDPIKLHTFTAQTQDSCVPSLIQMSTKQLDKHALYKLNPHKKERLSKELRELHMISEYEPLPLCESILREKNLLVLGATGSGKSTLVDAMLNYVIDVPFKDDCRFTMVDLTEDEQKLSTKQISSQTSGVTCYRIPRKEGFNIDFQLNIIDTPGFGDTRGKDHDSRISFMIEKLFKKSVSSIDAVCIVLPLSSHKLTKEQEYVFNNIVSLFAKNIKNNLFAMVTHDDGGDIQCLNALAASGIHVEEHFRFNNSDIFSKCPSEELWNKRQENFRRFFTVLDGVEKQSLKDSQNVLAAQSKLKVHLERIQDKIRIQVQTINNIRNEKTVMERYKMEIETNKNFTYKEIECVYEKRYCMRQSLNCPQCKETCHPGCWVVSDFFMFTCEVMKRGKCTHCKQKCLFVNHQRENFSYILKHVQVTKTKGDLEKKYNCALAEKEKHKRILDSEKKTLEESLRELDSMLKKVTEWIKQLNEIALKRENRTIQKFLGELICMELQVHDPQFEQRIEMIKMMQESLSKNKLLVHSMNELLQIH